MDEPLGDPEKQVLAEMVQRGAWHVPVRYDSPDPVCEHLRQRGLCEPAEIAMSEYLRRPPFPAKYRATRKGEDLIATLTGPANP